jgi:hypothetical protein
MELGRIGTRIKLTVIPILRTFDASFFVRLAIFATICYYGITFTIKHGPRRVMVK